MPFFGELFASEILRKPVLDPKGEELGKIRDLKLVKGEFLPRVDVLIIAKGKSLLKLPWPKLSIFNKKVIAASAGASELEKYEMREEDLLLARDILDKQIVDVNGVKVVRVNDVKLEGYKDDAVLVAVDVGMRGILRRLGFERGGEDVLKIFGASLQYNLISWNYIQPIQPKLTTLGLTVSRQMITQVHPADIAELVSHISRDEGAAFLESLDVETAADTIIELEPDAQTAIIKDMDADKASDIIEEMPPDVAADVLGNLSAEEAKAILEKMDKQEAEDIQELLGHEKDTAGGIMTNEFLAYPPGLSAGEVLKMLGRDAEEIESLHYVYIVEGEELIGALSLKDLILASPDAALSSIMETNLKTVAPDEDDMRVAEIMTKYNLVAMPVVDNQVRLLGIVTIDDIVGRLLPRKRRRRP